MSAFVKLSAILRGNGHSVFFTCPACCEWHGVNVAHPDRPRWTWNGNVDKPTFSPSLLVRTGRAVDPNWVPEEGDPPEVCHSFITDGRIQFLDDCTHDLAGQTVDLPPWDEKDGDE